MESPKPQENTLYFSHKNAPIFDFFIIIGLIFNALIAIFFVLYWLEFI